MGVLTAALAAYVQAASWHGRATEHGDSEGANSAACRIFVARKQLDEAGAAGQAALIGLLSHPDRGVRLWAASHALGFAPKEAEQVLRSLALLERSLVSFSAQTTLDLWNAGKLTA